MRLLLATQSCVPPSFKNSKMIARGKLITNPKYQKIMAKIIADFESQLWSAYQTIGDGTWTESQRRSWIATLPPDDAWQFVSELNVKGVRAPKGQEGADIVVEELNPR